MTSARQLRPRRDPAAEAEVRSASLDVRRWLILIVAGVVAAVGAPAVWLATRPAASVGAPVVVPVETSRAGAQAATPGSAAPSVLVTPAALPQPAGQDGARPQRLSMPALGINAPIDPVGVDANGAMALPEDVRRVGWYRFNPAPGADQGSVVISGHVDDAEQGKGAMFKLGSADVGDRITIRSADGTSHVYRVTGRQAIVKKRLPVENLFTKSGPPRLVLITCGGPFNTALSSYRDNLVVAAEPV